jgi:hypothetical protein
LKTVSVQVFLALDRVDLRKHRLGALVVTSDRNAFATSDVFAVTHADHNNFSFRAAAARNPKHFL